VLISVEIPGSGLFGKVRSGPGIINLNQVLDQISDPPPFVMLLMRENPLRGQVGEGWAQEIDTFLGTVKWHRVVRRVSFGAQKSSVPDPNPDPPDPHVFGPPGSFCHHAKIVRKTLIPTIL
jgi:hypothetical protein